MSVKNAITKSILRKVNESHTRRQLQKSHNLAYKQTGKEIEEAKKNGTFFNGKKRCRDNEKKIKQSILKKSKDRETFINDL